MGTHEREREKCVTSRRQAMRTIAISGLAAAVPLGAAALGDETSPDAELIRLGAEFDRLYSEWLPLWRRWSDFESVTRTEALAFAGKATSVWERYCQVSNANGCAEATAANDAASDKVTEVAGRIRQLPARGIHGLYVKARVVLFESFATGSHDSVADEDMDWEVLCYVQFLREIASLAGEARV
ncbi:hypothetical protein [Ancylobacter pratisalsi]|uniref:Uncharacterized protein n=1 Tax=Ancylobacter pratisalsi TaxID=1745854 RepID=A0A6P1YKD2_9HYPH|nr:hypothetical protein [Ancylobacter pratisalsi]QIB32673.1 hypothetical protein G3A50_02375 [Ancylobacter pratisalsi]